MNRNPTLWSLILLWKGLWYLEFHILVNRSPKVLINGSSKFWWLKLHKNQKLQFSQIFMTLAGDMKLHKNQKLQFSWIFMKTSQKSDGSIFMTPDTWKFTKIWNSLSPRLPLTIILFTQIPNSCAHVLKLVQVSDYGRSKSQIWVNRSSRFSWGFEYDHEGSPC